MNRDYMCYLRDRRESFAKSYSSSEADPSSASSSLGSSASASGEGSRGSGRVSRGASISREASVSCIACIARSALP